MKCSHYNKLLISYKSIYACNLLTDAVLSFPKESESIIHLILTYPNIDYENDVVNEIKELLYANGFLIHDDFDELKNLKERYFISQSKRNTFCIQIANTLRCNFRCTYCYELHESIDLCKIKQNSLIQFVERNIHKWNKLCISWFGGEPLLRPDIIEYISERLITICDEQSVYYEGFITTNGYLLNQDNAKLLKLCRVREAQITIDGDKTTHDQRRFLINGKGTYDVIINNIFEVANHINTFRIRVNVDTQVKLSLTDIIDKLDPIRDKVWLGFMPVQKIHCNKNEIYSYEEYHNTISGLYNLAVNRGYRIAPGYRLPGSTYCGTYDENYFLVDARGDLHKCVVMTGKPEYRIGYLNDDGHVIYLINPLNKWDFDPFRDKDCLYCDCLPLCMGGCQNFSFEKKRESGRCIVKDNLDRNLITIIESGQKDNIIGRAAY